MRSAERGILKVGSLCASRRAAAGPGFPLQSFLPPGGKKGFPLQSLAPPQRMHGRAAAKPGIFRAAAGFPYLFRVK
jgi:hypothetical protein